MKKSIIVTSLLAALSLGASGTAVAATPEAVALRWHYFTAPGTGIRMQIPTPAKRQHRVTDTILGDIQTHYITKFQLRNRSVGSL